MGEFMNIGYKFTFNPFILQIEKLRPKRGRDFPKVLWGNSRAKTSKQVFSVPEYPTLNKAWFLQGLKIR